MKGYLTRAAALVVGYCLFLSGCAQSAAASNNVLKVDSNETNSVVVLHDDKRGATCYVTRSYGGISCIADQWLTPQGQQ